MVKGMMIENVNDLLSLLTLFGIVGVPVFLALRKLYSSYQSFSERRIERLMKEEDWHM